MHVAKLPLEPLALPRDPGWRARSWTRRGRVLTASDGSEDLIARHSKELRGGRPERDAPDPSSDDGLPIPGLCTLEAAVKDRASTAT